MASVSVCTRVLRALYSLPRSNNFVNHGSRFMSTVPNEGTKPEGDQPITKENGEAAEDSKTGPSELETQLTEEKVKLQAQFDEIQDKYKRSLAETENVRRRMQKQIDDAKLFGIQGFCKDMLEVADILNKATDSVPEDLLKDTTTPLYSLFQGLSMTESQLQKVFTRHGLITINPAEGDKFDPNFHEALFEQAVAGKTGGTVAVVTKIGYKLHQRTIRPALVGVFKAS